LRAGGKQQIFFQQIQIAVDVDNTLLERLDILVEIAKFLLARGFGGKRDAGERKHQQ